LTCNYHHQRLAAPIQTHSFFAPIYVPQIWLARRRHGAALLCFVKHHTVVVKTSNVNFINNFHKLQAKQRYCPMLIQGPFLSTTSQRLQQIESLRSLTARAPDCRNPKDFSRDNGNVCETFAELGLRELSRLTMNKLPH